MLKRTVSGITLTLLFIGMLTLAFNIQPVRASGTIYIRPDGSVEGTNKIQRDGNVYTFTDNIYDSIVVEIDNVVLDGAGYTLQGAGSGTGTDLSHRSNVTIKNTTIKAFTYGIWLDESSNNVIFQNNVTGHPGDGIRLSWSSNNNTISQNSVANNWYGIVLHKCSNNVIFQNNVTGHHGDGIRLSWSSNNTIYHNNVINNTRHLHSVESVNTWDDGYPSGGNYWSGHVCTGNPSDGTQPYIIDKNNIDYYPFQDPNGWLLPPPPPGYALTIWSLPSGVTFAIDDVSHTTPWSRTYGEGASVSLIVPEIYTVGDARYYWSQWSDGNTSRSRTVTMTTNITLTAYYTGPYYELTVTSSPVTGIRFTIDDEERTTPYTEWLAEGSYTIEMPETHNGYVWYHWLEDGDPNKTKTITLPGTTWTGVFVFAVQPYGPEAEFEAIPDTASTGESIKFDASASLPGWNGTHEMPITEYRWDFGDGNQTTTSTPTVYHGFSSSGIYYVTLTVYAPGATPEMDSTTHKVTVISVPVGGYSIPIKGYTAEKPLTLYLALIAILTVSFTIAKRRKKQQS